MLGGGQKSLGRHRLRWGG